MKFGGVKYTHTAVQPMSRTLLIMWNRISSLNNSTCLPPARSWEPPLYLSVSLSLTTLDISCKWHMVLVFLTGLFHLTTCLQGSSMLQHISEFPSFLRIFHCTFIPHLFSHSSMDIWVASNLLSTVNNATLNLSLWDLSIFQIYTLQRNCWVMLLIFFFIFVGIIDKVVRYLKCTMWG